MVLGWNKRASFAGLLTLPVGAFGCVACLAWRVGDAVILSTFLDRCLRHITCVAESLAEMKSFT
jgi:hypothetical protein